MDGLRGWADSTGSRFWVADPCHTSCAGGTHSEASWKSCCVSGPVSGFVSGLVLDRVSDQDVAEQGSGDLLGPSLLLMSCSLTSQEPLQGGGRLRGKRTNWKEFIFILRSETSAAGLLFLWPVCLLVARVIDNQKMADGPKGQAKTSRPAHFALLFHCCLFACFFFGSSICVHLFFLAI